MVGDQLTKPAECPSPTHNRLRDEWAAYKTTRAEWAKAVQAGDMSKPEPVEPRRHVPIGNPHVCGRCLAGVRQQLGELPELAAHYLANTDGYAHDTREGERVAGSADPRSPSKPSDDVDELVRWLTEWEAALRGQTPFVARGHIAALLDTVVAQILIRTDLLAERDDVEAFAFGDRGVAWWHRYLTAKTRAGRRTLRQSVRCDRCREYNLWWTEGDENVECRGMTGTCGRIIAKATIEEWINAAYQGDLAAT